MSLVIEGEDLHGLCLMCNLIGYCIYAFIQYNIWIELNTHVCGNPFICLHVKQQGFHHNK